MRLHPDEARQYLNGDPPFKEEVLLAVGLDLLEQLCAAETVCRAAVTFRQAAAIGQGTWRETRQLYDALDKWRAS